MGIVTLKSNDYFVISLKNPKKITIISLLITGQPKKITINSLPITCPPQKKYRLTRYSLLSLKKVSIISLVFTVPSKK